ncbi:MAG TPA: DNA polymerase III subunit alpha [Bacilli bacterium]|nr:DNA polymerase III subunit alpha [Bacilli bacterium]HPS18889.1 DNA polymerase III subunit alpha [Bacilli bacterium]
MSKFAPIHIISSYSFLKSGLTMRKIARSVEKQGYFGAGLADFDCMYGIPEFVHAMEEIKKPFIVGLNIAIDGANLSLYALDEVGYHHLININTAIQKNQLSLAALGDNSKGLACVMEANHGAFFERFSALEKVDTAFTKWLNEYSKFFDRRFYLGLEVVDLVSKTNMNKVREFAKNYSYRCVAFPRIRYEKKDDAIVLKIVSAIAEGGFIKEKKAEGYECFMPEADYHKLYQETEIDVTNELIQKSTFAFMKKRGEMLHFSSRNSDEQLKEIAWNKLKEYRLDNNQPYIDRLSYELTTISSMGYSDYFLLVQDYVNWAKKQGILVGAGRGSAAGSLVSYLLNITEVDPIFYRLQFERFLNPARKSMPDIDVDFMDIKREEVIQYMRDKYGRDKVSTIVTFQTILARQALRDIGRVYQYPERHIVLLSKAISNPRYSLGQAYKNLPEFQKIVDSDPYFKEYVSLAGKIEGLPRQSGQHAAGIILNNTPIENSIPVSIDFNDNYISQYEAEYLEEQGFLKMDFLGIRNLTTVSVCVDLIDVHYPDLHLDKTKIPYDTPEIFSLISSGHTIGLFQIETSVMRKGIQTLKPSCFEDVVALIALNRPGPMPYVKNYANRRDGKEKIVYLSEDLKDILAPTYGIIVYQEQINQIASVMAGLSPSEADLFRRAVSKKDKAILLSLGKQFIEGSIKNHHSESVSKEVFDDILKFADYGFNRSHSVVYAVLACRMAWLKAHYPLEFYVALLETSLSANDSKFIDNIAEMRAMGIKILPPNINESQMAFSINNKALLFPLTSINGINDLTAASIIKERENGPFKDFFDFVTRLFASKISENQVLKLINAGAFDSLYGSRASLRNTIKAAMQYSELVHDDNGQLSIGIASIAPPEMIEDQDDPIENLDLEYDAIGVMLSSNILDYKQDLLKAKNVVSIGEIPEHVNVSIAGIVKIKKVIKTKKGSSMAFVKIFDQTGDIEVTVFPQLFAEKAQLLEKNNIVLIKGKYEVRNDESGFIAEDIENLEG